MADYDVEVIGLSTPPPAAVRTTYRPAISVRNNGIHDALASGYIRIYSAGLLIFQTEVHSAVIPPGDTRPALGVDYWTPDTEGTYLVNGYVTCPLDQVESNNNLRPTTIIVSGEPPPPPTPVALHASQHEEGGGDELIIDGLHGRAADPQTPIDHAAEHQVGGSDELSVQGLRGILADGQPIADHHETHEDGGGDELNVDNLHGVLYNKQKPQTHGNEAHDPNYSPYPHSNVYHSVPYMSVPAALYLRDVDAPPITYINGATQGTPLSASLPTGYLQEGDVLFLEAYATALLPDGGIVQAELKVRHNGGSWQTLATIPAIDIPSDPDNPVWITIRGVIPVFVEESALVLQPVIDADFFRALAELTPFWFRLRNNYSTHPILSTDALDIRLLFTTPGGAGNYAYFSYAALGRGRPNHPE